MPIYHIYLITNTINGKRYVGRSKDGMDKRWSVHKAHARYGEKYTKKSGKVVGQTYLYKSMRKHGIENFRVDLLEEVYSFQEMVSKEAYYIRLYGTTDPKIGYNLIIDEYEKDGAREFTSPETSRRISFAGATKRDEPMGVSWDKTRNKWMVALRVKNVHIKKRFDFENQAKMTADRLRIYGWGIENITLYYPEKKDEYLKEDLEVFFRQARDVKKSQSKYRGVRLCQGHHIVRVSLPNGGRLFVGTDKDEDRAAIIYDKVMYYLWNDASKLNCPDKLNPYDYRQEGERIYLTYADPRKQIQRKSPKTSLFNGVNKRSTYTWEMIIVHDKQRIREIYATELDAARAFDYYVRQFNLDLNKLNFPKEVITIKPESLPADRKCKKAFAIPSGPS